MTDDLVKRLRRDIASGLSASIGDTQAAADRIEGLEKALSSYACRCLTDDEGDCEMGGWDKELCGRCAINAMEAFENE